MLKKTFPVSATIFARMAKKTSRTIDRDMMPRSNGSPSRLGDNCTIHTVCRVNPEYPDPWSRDAYETGSMNGFAGI
jgi:hypothetical protein